ncbi:transglutaminase domain-containing protein, partial [bacterium]|nr:transglutaminase domain-containing protein [bacterium]
AYCVIAQKAVETAHLRMHIPVITNDSSPLFLVLDPQKKDSRIRGSRILHRDVGLDNELLEVEIGPLAKGDSVFIPFDSWTLKRRNQYEDLPEYIDVSRLQDLPANIKKYLNSSPLSQSRRFRIINQAHKLAGNELNVRQVVTSVVDYTSQEIEYAGGVKQDAINVLLEKQAVCHGKANLAVALLRALNIPARSLMVANTHYIIEYFAPEYGWIRAESTSGQSILPAEKNTVLWVATPSDETRSPYNGLICYWGVSDPGMAFDILYDEARLEEMSSGMDIRPRAADEILHRTQAVWRLQNMVNQQNTTDAGKGEIQKARAHQWQAVLAFQKNNPKNFVRNLAAARKIYEQIASEKEKTGYHSQDDFDETLDFMGRDEKFRTGNLPK